MDWRKGKKTRFFFKEKEIVKRRPKTFEFPDHVKLHIYAAGDFEDRTDGVKEFTAYANVKLKNTLWAYNQIFGGYPEEAEIESYKGTLKESLENMLLKELMEDYVLPDLHIMKFFLVELELVKNRPDKRPIPIECDPEN